MRIQQRKANIVTRVPREGAPRISPSVAKAAKKIAQDGGVSLDISPRTQTAVREMVSTQQLRRQRLLMSCCRRALPTGIVYFSLRALKGDPNGMSVLNSGWIWNFMKRPTQPRLFRFLIDKGSHLYYDPSALVSTEASANSPSMEPTPLADGSVQNVTVPPSPAYARTPSGSAYRDLTPASFSVPPANSRSESLAPSERRRRTGRTGNGREGIYQY
jgi:hypothetical protein